MNAYGHWVIGLAVSYTAILVLAGRIARRKARADSGAYFVGGRQFSPLLVAFCITGLFSGSTFIAVLELSYLKGISAAWYGVAETLQVLLIALFLVAPFRERSLVTISGLIGDHYGRTARAVAGAITAFAFPDVVSRDGTCLRVGCARLDRNSNDLVAGAHRGIVAGLSSGRRNVVDRANANYQLLHFRRDDGNRLVRDLERTEP
jgi:hypothetical protein